MTTSVVIPTWDGWSDLQQCLGALPTDVLERTVVVDNGSQDGTPRLVREHFPTVRLVALPRNTGFAYAVNRGIEACAPDDVILLNNDAIADPGFVATLTEAAAGEGPDVGFVQAKMLRLSDGRIDSAGDDQTWLGQPRQRGHGEADLGQWDARRDIGSACGGASWFRRAMLDDVGLLEERFFAYYEDVDVCLRARLRGWRGRFAPEAVVRHAVSASSGRVQGFKRFQSTRNGWWLLARTTPTPLMPRLLPRFLALQALLLVQAAARGELRAALRGHLAGLRAMPRVLAERRRIQEAATVTPEVFAEALLRLTVSGEVRAVVRAKLDARSARRSRG